MPAIAPSIDTRRLIALDADVEAAASAWHGASRQEGEASRALGDLRRRRDALLAMEPRQYSDGPRKRADLDIIEKQIADASAELKVHRGAVEDAHERLTAATALRDACRTYAGAV